MDFFSSIESEHQFKKQDVLTGRFGDPVAKKLTIRSE